MLTYPITSPMRSMSVWRRYFSIIYPKEEVSRLSLAQWSEAFKKETIDVAKMDISTISYHESANRMRALFKSRILRYDDIVHHPERFFLAHRLLAYHAPQLGPGFWIRFTVHYNLCLGSIVGLGSDEQVKELDLWQEKGLLGCFSLTEKFAGVNSGLVVNTTADYDETNDSFILNTPQHGAKKNWISQGLVADKTTVVANLRINGKSYGPHAFMMSLRENSVPVTGVTHGDMGKKTIGNDLDNAWIAFDNVRLPKSSLLNRYADIVNGEYVQKVKGLPVFHMIGQRLFTGRVAVAQAALQFRRRIFDMTKEYTDSKLCWSPNGDVPLSTIPQLNHLYQSAELKASKLDVFVNKCEQELTKVLVTGGLPSIDLVEAIAVAKVKAVEESIALTHALKNEVGSYALMANTGFDQSDFLQCCKFAEGDSRILMQKMARDRVKLFSKYPMKDGSGDTELLLCSRLHEAMENASTPEKKLAVWDERWEEVYALADAIMNRIMSTFVDSSSNTSARNTV